MKKIGIVMTLVVVLLAFSVSIWAFEKGNSPRQGQTQCWTGQPHRGDIELKALNLTSEQNESIQKLQLKLQKDRIPVESKIKELQLDERSLVMNKDIDESKWLDLIEQIGKHKIVLRQKCASEQLAILKLLTDAQQQKYRESRFGCAARCPHFGGKNCASHPGHDR